MHFGWFLIIIFKISITLVTHPASLYLCKSASSNNSGNCNCLVNFELLGEKWFQNEQHLRNSWQRHSCWTWEHRNQVSTKFCWLLRWWWWRARPQQRWWWWSWSMRPFLSQKDFLSPLNHPILWCHLAVTRKMTFYYLSTPDCFCLSLSVGVSVSFCLCVVLPICITSLTGRIFIMHFAPLGE